MNIRNTLTLIAFVLLLVQVTAQNKFIAMNNYLKLTQEQLQAIGFKEKDGCLTFHTRTQRMDCIIDLCDDNIDIAINTAKNDSRDVTKNYHPVFVTEANGKIHFEIKKDKKRDKFYLPILVKSNVNSEKGVAFLFNYSNDLSKILADVQNIESFLVEDKDIEKYLNRSEKKECKNQ